MNYPEKSTRSDEAEDLARARREYEFKPNSATARALRNARATYERSRAKESTADNQQALFEVEQVVEVVPTKQQQSNLF